MPPVSVTPETRAACVAAVAKFKAALPPLIASVKGGMTWSSGIQFAMFLVSFSAEVSELVKRPGAAGVLGAELVDGYSGSDPGALINITSLLPGVTPEQGETLFDSLKPIIEEMVNARLVYEQPPVR